MEKQDYLTLSAVQVLKKEFKEAREIAEREQRLKLATFTDHITERHPEWNSINGGKRIQSAWNGLSGDVLLTREIQALVGTENKLTQPAHESTH